MIITAAHHRPLGKTGPSVPPLLFAAHGLTGPRRVLTDQAKLEICGAWFQSVAPPVFIELLHESGAAAATRAVARAFERLEIEPHETLISLRLGPDSLPVTCESAATALEDLSRALGGKHRPQLVAIDAGAVLAWAPPDERARRFNDVLECCRIFAELRSAGQFAALGIAVRDVGLARTIESATALDWLLLDGCLTILRHPPVLLEYVAEAAGRGVGVVVSSVFQGGFLLGGSRLEGRALDSSNPSDRATLAWRKSLAALCYGHGIAPAHASIQFCLGMPGVAAVSIRTSHADRVALNAEYAATDVPAAFWAAMKEEDLLSKNTPYRRSQSS